MLLAGCAGEGTVDGQTAPTPTAPGAAATDAQTCGDYIDDEAGALRYAGVKLAELQRVAPTEQQIRTFSDALLVACVTGDRSDDLETVARRAAQGDLS